MKILLVCAGGMSTSILMKKMEKYWADQGEELSIKAVGVPRCGDAAREYDIVMVGPQVSYRMDYIKEATGLPCAAIVSMDYALADCPNIMKLARELYGQR